MRQLVRTAAIELRLSLVDQTKLVTAASELARNTLVYGGGGRASVEVVSDGRGAASALVFSDDGPGIADLDLALTDGYTTGGGLGLGLSGAADWSTSSSIDTDARRGNGRDHGDQVDALTPGPGEDVWLTRRGRRARSAPLRRTAERARRRAGFGEARHRPGRRSR